MAFFLLVISVIGLGSYTFAGLYNAERLTLIGIVRIPAFIGFGAGRTADYAPEREDIA